MDYKVLYGISLAGYCVHHNITIKELKDRVKKDIELLEINYKKYASRNEKLNDNELFIAISIKNLLNKKKKHLEDIEKEEKREQNNVIEPLQTLLTLLITNKRS